LIPKPIRKVLSTIRKHRVRPLLMGGQACVFHGASEISRDTDFAILADAKNLERLQRALNELRAEVIAVPPFKLKYLRKGHAVHFRCAHPNTLNVRIDVMSKMRGVAPFATLWRRRATISLPNGEAYDVLAVGDLVRAKKTQHDKDWPMLRRLVEAHLVAHRTAPTPHDLKFWLLELRTPVLLVEIAQLYPKHSSRLLSKRPLLAAAVSGDLDALEKMLDAEEAAERERDKLYWMPLRKEIEQLRHQEARRKGATKFEATGSEGFPQQHDSLIVAIERRQALKFFYEGYERIVEPQTYGMSFTGRYVLRALQTGGASSSGDTNIAKLFDVAKISKLQKTGGHFKNALPSHNPEDSAMKVVFASLPRPEAR
jgi:hypothetical protein